MPKPTLETILSLEQNVWSALMSADVKADQQHLADNFLGVYSSGFATKQDHVNQLADGPTVLHYELTDARLKILSDSLALLSYKALWQRPNGTKDQLYISSIWEHQHGKWKNIFSQDTRADH